MMKRNNGFIIILLSLAIITGCSKKEYLAKVVTGDNTIYSDGKTVSCDGYVEDDGGSTVFARGVCYVKGAGIPTVSDQSVSGGSGRGAFSCPISLTSEGLYSYRAYATNSVGTNYGDVRKFTITSSHDNQLTIEDFIGTYNFYGYNEYEEKYESWSGVKIDKFTGSDNTTWVYVEGLLKNGASYFTALGKFDQQNQCIRLFSDWYFNDRTFIFQNNGDTVYYATFNPLALENGTWYYLVGGNGYNGASEAWFSFGSDGKLVFGPSNTPDNYGHYAHGYTFKCYRNDDDYYCGNLEWYSNIKLTKVSKGQQNWITHINDTPMLHDGQFLKYINKTESLSAEK